MCLFIKGVVDTRWNWGPLSSKQCSISDVFRDLLDPVIFISTELYINRKSGVYFCLKKKITVSTKLESSFATCRTTLTPWECLSQYVHSGFCRDKMLLCALPCLFHWLSLLRFRYLSPFNKYHVYDLGRMISLECFLSLLERCSAWEFCVVCNWGKMDHIKRGHRFQYHFDSIMVLFLFYFILFCSFSPVSLRLGLNNFLLLLRYHSEIITHMLSLKRKERYLLSKEWWKL